MITAGGTIQLSNEETENDCCTSIHFCTACSSPLCVSPTRTRHAAWRANASGHLARAAARRRCHSPGWADGVGHARRPPRRQCGITTDVPPARWPPTARWRLPAPVWACATTPRTTSATRPPPRGRRPSLAPPAPRSRLRSPRAPRRPPPPRRRRDPVHGGRLCRRPGAPVGHGRWARRPGRRYCRRRWRWRRR